MSLADELQKLQELRSAGTLSAQEFEQAKRKLLSSPAEERSGPPDERENSLGRAANRYVSFNIIMAVIGIIMFLIFFFTVFLPMFSGGPLSPRGPLP